MVSLLRVLYCNLHLVMDPEMHKDKKLWTLAQMYAGKSDKKVDILKSKVTLKEAKRHLNEICLLKSIPKSIYREGVKDGVSTKHSNR